MAIYVGDTVQTKSGVVGKVIRIDGRRWIAYLQIRGRKEPYTAMVNDCKPYFPPKQEMLLFNTIKFTGAETCLFLYLNKKILYLDEIIIAMT